MHNGDTSKLSVIYGVSAEKASFVVVLTVTFSECSSDHFALHYYCLGLSESPSNTDDVRHSPIHVFTNLSDKLNKVNKLIDPLIKQKQQQH